MLTRTQKRGRDEEAECDELVAKVQKNWDEFLDTRQRLIQSMTDSSTILDSKIRHLEYRVSRYQVRIDNLETDCKNLNSKLAVANTEISNLKALVVARDDGLCTPSFVQPLSYYHP